MQSVQGRNPDEFREQEPGAGPLPILSALVCEMRSHSDWSSAWSPQSGPDDELRERIVEILRAHGADVDGVQGNPDAIAAVFGPDPADGDGPWRAVLAAWAAREAVLAEFEGATSRIGVGTTEVDDDPSAAALWRTRAIDLAIRLQKMAEPDEVILGEAAYRRVSPWVDVDPVEGREPVGDEASTGPLRLIGVAPATEDTKSPELPSFELEVDRSAASEPPGAEAADGWESQQPSDLDEALGDDPDEQWPELALASIVQEDDLEDDGASDEPATELPEPAERDEAAEPPGLEPDPELEPDLEAGPDLEPAPEPDTAFGPDDERLSEAAPPEAEAGSQLLERDEALERLRGWLARVIEEGAPRVVSVAASGGLGATTLVEAFAAEVVDAYVVRLPCPPAERGGTTRPLVSLVEALSGVVPEDQPDEVREKLRAALDGDPHGDSEGLTDIVVGNAASPITAELRPALGRLLEISALRVPLLLVADDAANGTRGTRRVLSGAVRACRAPVLAIFVQEGSAGIDPDDEVRLSPLGEGSMGALVDAMLGHGGLASDPRQTVVGACAGNPLAVQQMVAMLLDDGFLRWEYGRWVSTVDLATLALPSDVRSLVAARLDRLDDTDRRLLALGAAIGERFPAAILEEDASAGGSEVRTRLFGLVDRRILTFDEASQLFAFVHPTIAEAVADPADTGWTHERAAAWLEASGLARGAAGAELVGAHLAAAVADGGPGELAERAARALAAGADGAAALGEDEGSLALLRRAAALLPAEHSDRTDLLLEAGLRMADRGELLAAERVLAEAEVAARAADDPRQEARATVLRASVRARAGASEEALETLRDAADTAIELCARAGDDTGLAWAWAARATVHRYRGHWAAAADAAERAATYADRAGRRGEKVAALLEAARAILDGPAPVAESRERCAAILELLRGATPAQQEVAATVAVLLAREGQAAEARERTDAAIAQLEATTHRGALARCLWLRALLETLAHEPGAAEPILRRAMDESREAQEAATHAKAAATLANLLVDLGRSEGVDELISLGRDGAARDDVYAQVAWRCARAKQRAAEGRAVEARSLVRVAVRLADQTDLVELRASALLDHAEVLRLLGRPNEAQPSARKALRSLERRGAAASAARAREAIDRLRHRRTEPEPKPDPEPAAGAEIAEPEVQASADAGPPAEPAARPEPEAATEPAASVESSPNGTGQPAETERREKRWFW